MKKIPAQCTSGPVLLSIFLAIGHAAVLRASSVDLSQLLNLRDESAPVQLGIQAERSERKPGISFSTLDEPVDAAGLQIADVPSDLESPTAADAQLVTLLPSGAAAYLTPDARRLDFTSSHADFQIPKKPAEPPAETEAAAGAADRKAAAGRTGKAAKKKPISGFETMMLRTANPFVFSLGTGIDETGAVSNTLKRVATAVRPLEDLATGGAAGISGGEGMDWRSDRNVFQTAWRLARENPVLSMLGLIVVGVVVRAILT
jgi:hypothetical protein